MFFLELALLYALGIIGCFLGKKSRLPAAPILGTLIFLITLQLLGVPLPDLPEGSVLAIQVALGIMVGARFNEETRQPLRGISRPALMVSTWAISLAFISGLIIHSLTDLNLPTAILSSSVGGLPEMTVLAVATDADPVIVIFFHITRLLVTLMLFPLVLKLLKTKFPDPPPPENQNNQETISSRETSGAWPAAIFTVAGTALIGFLSHLAQIPAGGLVGAILFMVIGGRLRLPIYHPPAFLLNWFLIGVGVMIADRVDVASLAPLLSVQIILPLFLSIVLILGSSFFLAFLIYRFAGWDPISAYLAAAPAGFTIMTTLALQENRNPVAISLMHLTRLMVLKLVLPFVFMLFY